MSKSLKTVQVVFKVLKIVSLVLFILCIIGAIGSFLGAVLSMTMDNATCESAMNSGEDLTTIGAKRMDVIFICLAAAVSCTTSAVMFKFSEKYCANELKAGTPFTHQGAKELMRLGIMAMIVSVGTAMVISLINTICWISDPQLTSASEYSADITGGLAMIFVSLIFKYGAELREEKAQAESQSAKLSAPEEQPADEEQAVEQ
jgi:hypothetical protein